MDDWGFGSYQGLGIFLPTTASRLALGPMQPPIQGVPGSLSLGVKWPGCEAHHSHLHLVPRSRMHGAIAPLPNTPLWHAQLKKGGKKQRDNFNIKIYKNLNL
jgi:hypothetical protein